MVGELAECHTKFLPCIITTSAVRPCRSVAKSAIACSMDMSLLRPNLSTKARFGDGKPPKLQPNIKPVTPALRRLKYMLPYIIKCWYMGTAQISQLLFACILAIQAILCAFAILQCLLARGPGPILLIEYSPTALLSLRAQ